MQVNQMEREFAGYLQWTLSVDHEEMLEMEALLTSEYGPLAPAPAAISAPVAAAPVAPTYTSPAHYAHSAYPSPPFSPVSLSTSSSSSGSPASSMGSITPPIAVSRTSAKHDDSQEEHSVRVAGELDEEAAW